MHACLKDVYLQIPNVYYHRKIIPDVTTDCTIMSQFLILSHRLDYFESSSKLKTFSDYLKLPLASISYIFVAYGKIHSQY